MKQLLCTLTMLCCLAVNAQDIAGPWKGALAVQGATLNLVFNIEKSSTGYTATMDSPDQGVTGIPFTTVSFANNNLTLSIPAGQVEFTGALQGGSIAGTYKQGPNSWPLKLERGLFEQRRPQEPVGPFPYNEEDITFRNVPENIDLAGTLTLPRKGGPFPVAILISGSGQQDRNSTVMGHKPFLLLADHLTKAGIAVLRFDDRGVGSSKGNPLLSTTANFAEDVRAAVQYLQNRKDIDPSKIGMIGHSEGGLIAPMVASGSKAIDFIILLAAPGLPGDQLLLGQTEAIARTAGGSDEDVKAMLGLNGKIYEAVKKNRNAEDLERELKKIFADEYSKIPASARPSQVEYDAAVNQQLASVSAPWFQHFVSYDPSPALKNIKCPVLVLNGDKDLQVPAASNTAAIKNHLQQGGNKHVEVHILPGLNHLFQEAKTGSVDEYRDIEQTFAPAALDLMTSWILKQIK